MHIFFVPKAFKSFKYELKQGFEILGTWSGDKNVGKPTAQSCSDTESNRSRFPLKKP